MKTFFVIYILSISTLCFSQHKIDSLKTLLDNQVSKSEFYVDIVNDIGYQYWIVNSNESLKYGKRGLKLSDSLNYKKGQAKANRVLGVAYWTRGNHLEAIKHLNDALKQNKALNDLENIANCTLNLAMVYAALNDEEKALNMYEDVINQFTALNLKSRIATTFTKIGSIYIDQNKFEEAKEYLTNALKMHTDENFVYGIAEAHNRLGVLYIKLDEKEQAYYHIQKAIINGRAVNDADGMTSNLIQYGKLLILDNEFDTAEEHLVLAAKRAKEKNLKRYELEAYKELKDLKRLEGKPDEALNYYDKYIFLKDSIFNSEKTMRIAALELNNEIESNKKELELFAEKEYTNNIIKWALVLGLLTLVVVAIIYYLNLIKRTSQRRELQIAKEESNKTELENSKLKQQELRQKLDYRNKELTSYTLNFVQKSELFQQLKEKIESFKVASPKQQEHIIKDLNHIIRQHINIDRDWEDFKRYFEEVHTGFIEKLKEKHPDLSSNDLRICALIRLNLNIKESASILGITAESVKTARYRLRKKLNLEAKDELLSYFLELEN
ncbi:Tetratricopeptide repeat-containing protein [Flaviramulus basaltis]|uniref:Tetratricopeptide repeat-containing protein n=1 Tax=Flaviramulus basaltis TaxID=369401 RepID=A0A1K2IME1_9FLAO|nr:tetratricopeptide repeat protein [Flaviramulus basaltis]SFZ92835.1 Tetratricopeptide repeat-containing protein [Flaviramulus basaltis]